MRKRKKRIRPSSKRERASWPLHTRRGVHFNERDRHGWRIPREGTLSRLVYEMVRSGAAPKEIAQSLCVDVRKVRVLAHRFRNPDWASQRNG